MKDLVIIGGAAAGTAAAVYSARRKLDFVLVSEDWGGEVARSGEVWNYPGFVESNGVEMAQKFREHVDANDVDLQLGVWVESVQKQPEGHFVVNAKKGEESLTYEAKAVIIATGVHPRRLGVPGEDEYEGKGVTWCTTCDGPLYKGKKVVTIGGGNSAMESALMLAEIGEHVTVINKNADFKGETVLKEKLLAHPKIDIVYNAMTTEITGEMFVNGVKYTDADGNEHTVETQGVFIHIGLIPNSGMVGEEVTKNNFGEIEVDNYCQTNIDGLFAAGDVTNVPFKQIVISAGQGSVAALAAIEYTNKLAA